MKENYVYVLLADTDLTMRSQPEPIGIAVTSEAEAKRYVAGGSYRDYRSVRVFNSLEEWECDREQGRS